MNACTARLLGRIYPVSITAMDLEQISAILSFEAEYYYLLCGFLRETRVTQNSGRSYVRKNQGPHGVNSDIHKLPSGLFYPNTSCNCYRMDRCAAHLHCLLIAEVLACSHQATEVKEMICQTLD